MSDDLREQIAQTLSGPYPAIDEDYDLADAVLAVVQPIIEKLERERDASARFGESTQDYLRARVATLEAGREHLMENDEYQIVVGYKRLCEFLIGHVAKTPEERTDLARSLGFYHFSSKSDWIDDVISWLEEKDGPIWIKGNR